MRRKRIICKSLMEKLHHIFLEHEFRPADLVAAYIILLLQKKHIRWIASPLRPALEPQYSRFDRHPLTSDVGVSKCDCNESLSAVIQLNDNERKLVQKYTKEDALELMKQPSRLFAFCQLKGMEPAINQFVVNCGSFH